MIKFVLSLFCCLLVAETCWAGNSLTITASGYTSGRETLTNFPVLVVIGTNIPGFAYSQFASTNGWDLRVYSGTNELNYEVESWGAVGNSNSFVWVQVPLLTNGTAITATWGDATKTQPPYTTNGAVWSQGYMLVSHNGGYTDSSTNRFNGSPSNGVAVSATAGMIGPATVFDGVDDYYNLGVTALNTQTNDLTVSVLLKSGMVPTTGKYGTILGAGYLQATSSPDIGGYGLFFETLVPVQAYWQTRYSTSVLQTVAVATDSNVFCNIVGVRSQTTGYNTIFVNGSGIFSTNGIVPSYSNGLPFGVGCNYSRGSAKFRVLADPGAMQPFVGIMDEIRISSVVRSTNWIWAEYINMTSNSAFQTYGSVTTILTPRFATITFSGYPSGRETLTNFPALVVMGTNVPGYSLTQQAYWPGWDFRFYFGSTELNYEIDSLPTVSNLTYNVWVQVPLLTNGTQITARWGDASKTQQPYTTNGATWSAAFKFVSHNGGRTDSSPNLYAVSITGNPSVVVGAIGDATLFGSTLAITNFYALNSMTGGLGDGAWTISTLFYPTYMAADAPRQGALYCEFDTVGNSKNYLCFGQLSTHMTFRQVLLDQFIPTGNTSTTLPLVVQNQWTYGAGVQLSSSTRYSVCGTNIGSMSTETYAGGTPVQNAIGYRVTTSTPWWINGMIDEIRLATVARSTNWLYAEYMNMASNSVFQTYGLTFNGQSIPKYFNQLGYDTQL